MGSSGVRGFVEPNGTWIVKRVPSGSRSSKLADATGIKVGVLKRIRVGMIIQTRSITSEERPEYSALLLYGTGAEKENCKINCEKKSRLLSESNEGL